jgi:hypothetical protein
VTAATTARIYPAESGDPEQPRLGAGPAVFGLIRVSTGYPAAFALTGALILATLPAALRERKAAVPGLAGQPARRLDV